MNKTLLYIAAAALGTVALGACDDDLAYPPCPDLQPAHSPFLALAFPSTGAYDLCNTKDLS